MNEVVATYNEEWQLIGEAYPPGGCRIMVGREKCGETRGLDIIMDFHKLYQDKMSEIDVSAGGDSLQEKVNLQQQWIKDLTEQNKMLARVIEELESEAIGRVQQLENKLNNATKSLGENDEDTLIEKDKKIKELEEALKRCPEAEELKNKIQENGQIKKHESSSERLIQNVIPQTPTDSMDHPKYTEASGSRKTSNPKNRKESDSKSRDPPELKRIEEQNETRKDSLPTKKRDETTEKLTQEESETRKESVSTKIREETEVKLEELKRLSDTAEKSKLPTNTERPSGGSRSEENETTSESGGYKNEFKDKNQEIIEESPKGPISYDMNEKVSSMLQLQDEISECSQASELPVLVENFDDLPQLPSCYDATCPNKLVSKTQVSQKSKGVESSKSDKSVHLIIEQQKDYLIVEPEKLNFSKLSTDYHVPQYDSVPVVGTQDSIELQKGVLRKHNGWASDYAEDGCGCGTTGFWDELEKLKLENKMLVEGGEIQRLRDEVEDKLKRIIELNEENRALNDMINVLKEKNALLEKYSEEIDDLKKALKWSRREKEEYEHLKEKVKLLEQGKGDTQNMTSNLQTAVDVYADTITLMESSELRLKSEVEQYKTAHNALQESLTALRQEMKETEATFQENMDEQIWLNFLLNIDNVDILQSNYIYEQQILKHQKLYHHLMELNYEIEVEHVNTLQDLAMLETKFSKYITLLKTEEEDKVVMKTQLKKLSKKNKCYEEVVKFFKDEMSVMSDELLTLQEVLNATNVCSQEENNKLINAILQLRRINERLVTHICTIEKQVVLENQINKINEARINELQNIVGAKNSDLNQHDEIIKDMRKKLSNATKQNADLKKTIKNLTDTVVEIQEGIKKVEREQLDNREEVSVVESKVCLANGNLEDIKACVSQKNNKIVELENKLKEKQVALILATKELEMLKEKKSENKVLINSLKEQLNTSENKMKQIIGDYQKVTQQLQDSTSLEHMKNYELGHYKSLVEEMRMSLIQMNNGLEQCEASNIHFYEDSEHPHDLFSIQEKKSNLSLIFDDLKKSMSDMRRRLTNAEFKGGLIEEELLKVKESHMSYIQEEVSENQKDLEERVISSIEEQSRLNQIVEEQKHEIETLKRELKKEKEVVCCCKKSVSELKNEKMNSNAQMEISHLKCQLNKSYQRQRLINDENYKLHTQVINLRNKLTMVEQVHQELKQEHEQSKLQLKKTLREKEYLQHKKQDLTKTIEQMKQTYEALEKQFRYSDDRVQNLELELSDTKIEKEDITNEAYNLLGIVKMWLLEQNDVNGRIRGKFRTYSETIALLRQTIMKKLPETKNLVTTPMEQYSFSPRRFDKTSSSERRTSSPSRSKRSERLSDAKYRHSSPWGCLSSYLDEDFKEDDSHSMRSNLFGDIRYDCNSLPYSSRSPSPRSDYSPNDDEFRTNNSKDWISPNYKETDTDVDDGEDDAFINKVEMMTAQVQEANKRWHLKLSREHSTKSRPNK